MATHASNSSETRAPQGLHFTRRQFPQKKKQPRAPVKCSQDLRARETGQRRQKTMHVQEKSSLHRARDPTEVERHKTQRKKHQHNIAPHLGSLYSDNQRSRTRRVDHHHHRLSRFTRPRRRAGRHAALAKACPPTRATPTEPVADYILAGNMRAYHQSIAINSGHGHHNRRHHHQSDHHRHSGYRHHRRPKSLQRATTARMAPAAELR